MFNASIYCVYKDSGFISWSVFSRKGAPCKLWIVSANTNTSWLLRWSCYFRSIAPGFMFPKSLLDLLWINVKGRGTQASAELRYFMNYDVQPSILCNECRSWSLCSGVVAVPPAYFFLCFNYANNNLVVGHVTLCHLDRLCSVKKLLWVLIYFLLAFEIKKEKSW